MNILNNTSSGPNKVQPRFSWITVQCKRASKARGSRNQCSESLQTSLCQLQASQDDIRQSLFLRSEENNYICFHCNIPGLFLVRLAVFSCRPFFTWARQKASNLKFTVTQMMWFLLELKICRLMSEEWYAGMIEQLLLFMWVWEHDLDTF